MKRVVYWDSSRGLGKIGLVLGFVFQAALVACAKAYIFSDLFYVSPEWQNVAHVMFWIVGIVGCLILLATMAADDHQQEAEWLQESFPSAVLQGAGIFAALQVAFFFFERVSS